MVTRDSVRRGRRLVSQLSLSLVQKSYRFRIVKYKIGISRYEDLGSGLRSTRLKKEQKKSPDARESRHIYLPPTNH